MVKIGGVKRTVVVNEISLSFKCLFFSCPEVRALLKPKPIFPWALPPDPFSYPKSYLSLAEDLILSFPSLADSLGINGQDCTVRQELNKVSVFSKYKKIIHFYAPRIRDLVIWPNRYVPGAINLMELGNYEGRGRPLLRVVGFAVFRNFRKNKMGPSMPLPRLGGWWFTRAHLGSLVRRTQLRGGLTSWHIEWCIILLC